MRVHEQWWAAYGPMSQTQKFPTINHANFILSNGMHFSNGLHVSQAPQNSPCHLNRVTGVPSPCSGLESVLTRRTRRRVETPALPPIQFPQSLPPPTRLSTRSPIQPWVGRVKRVCRFLARPFFNSSAFNMGIAKRVVCFARYIEIRV